MSDDRLTVVVPTRDRPDLLAPCVEAIAASLRDGDELIVVDSGRPDGTVAAVVARCRGRLLASHPGASYQRNVGAAAGTGDLVAFVDDDVRVSPQWAGAIAAAFRAHPDVAFLTGRLDVPPEQAGYGRPVSVKVDDEPARLTSATRGTLGHSANLAVRRSAFLHVGGFDERLGPGAPFRAAEDGDLFDRLLAAGCVGRYEPAALGWHDQWRARGDLVRLEWSYGIGMGARLARLARSNRSRARVIASEYLWRNALRPLPSHLLRGHEYAVLFAVARVTGASIGFVRASLSRFGVRPSAAASGLA